MSPRPRARYSVLVDEGVLDDEGQQLVPILERAAEIRLLGLRGQ